MNPFVRVLLLLSLCLWPAPGVAQTTAAPTGPQRTERIEAELVSLSAWAAPGSTAVVAVKQTIQPGWHTYWRNPGDSGGATTLACRGACGPETSSGLCPSASGSRD